MTDINENLEHAWGNKTRSLSYAQLEFPNTYYLAYRDLPEIITRHVTKKSAIDFGCGTGRSTRFLKQQGFDVIGIDISKDMLEMARKIDPNGRYEQVENKAYDHLGIGEYGLVQAIFTFDNIPGWALRTDILKGLTKLLSTSGKMITLHSSPDIYTNEWVSFSTKDFTDNRNAETGDIVRTIMLDVEDRRPVDDVFWTIEDYHKLFHTAGLKVEAIYAPLGKKEEPFSWDTELHTAPWIIFVLQRSNKCNPGSTP